MTRNEAIKMIDYSKLFKDAHKEAKEIVAQVGDYIVAFKIALKDSWSKIDRPVSDAKIEALQKSGWSRWTKYGYDRLYFNIDETNILDIGYYNTGNICYSTWNGEKISHAEAYRLLSVKAYLDVKTGKFFINSNFSDEAKMIKEAADKKLEVIA